MRLLIIDPWGVNNTKEYLNGLIYGVSNLVDLTVATNFYFIEESDSRVILKRIFFKHSEKMRFGIIRKIVRGIEYYFAYRQILNILKKQKFDVVHINWLLNYRQDVKFLKKIKKLYPLKLVYTAHNAIPHTEGEKSIHYLQTIYKLADTIVLHGAAVKNEFTSYFSEFEGKVYLQKHGANIVSNISYDIKHISNSIVSRINRFDKVFICFGAIFYNKGVDRIANYWLNNKPNALLIIAGRQTADYPEFEALKSRLAASEDVMLIDRFVDDDTLNYLISESDLIILPYRHASMSGVVFTAADFMKAVLFTDCGAIKEYLQPGKDSIMCNNDDYSIYKSIEYALSLSKNDLIKMGDNLSKNIKENCNWRTICKELVTKVYM